MPEKCSYHDCEHKDNLIKCRYCDSLFCREHIKPKMALTLQQVSTAKEPMRSWLERQWRSKYGHPDYVYTEKHWEKLKEKEKEQQEKMWKALNDLKGTGTTHHTEKPSLPQISKPNFPKNVKEKIPFSFRRAWYKFRVSLYSFVKYTMIVLILMTLLHLFFVGKFDLFQIVFRSVAIAFLYYIAVTVYRKTKFTLPWKWVVIAVLFLISAYLYSTHDFSSLGMLDRIVGIKNFSNLAVSNLTTVLNASFQESTKLPIPLVQSPERKEDCMSAFDYLNSVRTSYGRVPLKWDDRLYALAVFRAKDLIDRNYFDHKTPEGKCAIDFAPQFNITETYYSIPENLGGMTHYADGTVTGNCREAVDAWLNSRGHRYNLLYPDHVSAAIGCYKYYCAFLALSRGLFPCASASEGISFWNNAPPQPGET